MKQEKHTLKTVFLSATGLGLAVILYLSGCSHKITSYDDLVSSGTLEQTAKNQYSGFFAAIDKIEKAAASDTASIDSTIILRAAQETDKLVAAIQDFPTTVNSRIAFDAISYAAGKLSVSPNFSRAQISTFWQNGLLVPLFGAGQQYVSTSIPLDSVHLQILKALQRGMGTRVNEQLIMDTMPIIGIMPSDKVMAFCNSDTLILKRIHDLIIYSRNLQETDPPLWLLSGNWLIGLQYPNAIPIFILLNPHITNGIAYLAFKTYRPGDLYAIVFDDSVPSDQTKWDAWIARANAVMNNLTFDDTFAQRVKQSTFSTAEAHYFNEDYLIHTSGDTLKREIYVSFVRNATRQGDEQFTGRDSIVVVFDEHQIAQSEGTITKLKSTRDIGTSMIAGTPLSPQSLTGTAYVMEVGQHDPEIVTQYRDQLIQLLTKQPEVSFQAGPPPGTPLK